MGYLIINANSRTLPIGDESVDAILTDPPYGIRVDQDGYGRRRLWNGGRHVSGDESLQAMQDGLTEGYRCLKRDSWALVFCSPKRHRESIEACEGAGFMYRGEFVWDKRIPGLGGGIRYQHENIILLAKGDPSGLCSLPSVLRFTSRTFNESLGHPSKKPEALFRCLLEYCCPAGGIVLDMFAGLGTTILAAETMGRSAIAVELEADYCSAIRRRIDRPHAPPATCANGNDHDTPLFAGLAQTEET